MNYRVAKSRTLLVVVVLTLPQVIAAAAWVSGRMSFNTNDDPVMISIASSGVPGAEKWQLVFPSPLVGLFLSGLYSFASGFAWYPATQLLLQSIAVSVLGGQILILSQSTRQWPGLALYGAILVIYAYMTLSIQFTQTAIIVAGSGAVAVAFGNTRAWVLGGLVMVFVGTSWRTEAGILAAVMVLIALWIFWQPNRHNLREPLLRSAAIVTAVGLATVTLRAVWSTWSPFASESAGDFSHLNSTVNAIQSRLFFAFSAEAQAAAQAAGLTANDWHLFNRWFYANPDIYSSEKLQQVADAAPFARVDSIAQFFQSMLLPEIPGGIVFVGLLIAGWLSISFLMPHPHRWRPAIAAVTSLVVVILSTGGRLPQRILLPAALIMLAASIVGVLAFLAKQDPSSISAPPTRIPTYTTSILVVAVTGAVLMILANQLVQRETPTLRNDFEIPDNVAVVAFWEFYSSEVFGIDPTEVGSIPTKQLDRMLLLGWPQQSPNFINQQAVLGLGQDPFDPTSPTCIWVGTKSVQDLVLIATYIHEHYGESVSFSEASGPHPDLWQMETSATCPSSQQSLAFSPKSARRHSITN